MPGPCGARAGRQRDESPPSARQTPYWFEIARDKSTRSIALVGLQPAEPATSGRPEDEATTIRNRQCWRYCTSVRQPPARQDHEADVIGDFAHDLDDDVLGFRDPLVIVATIGEDLRDESILYTRGAWRRPPP